jgi:ribosome modulation factor
LALEKQFELASFEDSGGTTKFGWAAIEEDQRRITDRDKLQTGASRGLSKEEKGYSKNIACYISKTVRRMMFGKYKDAVIRLCARKEVRYEDF